MSCFPVVHIGSASALPNTFRVHQCHHRGAGISLVFRRKAFVNSSVTIKRLSASIAFISAAGIALTGCSETESSSSAAFTGASGELVAEGGVFAYCHNVFYATFSRN